MAAWQSFRMALAIISVAACRAEITRPVLATAVDTRTAETLIDQWTLVELPHDPSHLLTVPDAINNRQQILGSFYDANGAKPIQQFTQRPGQPRQPLGPDFVATTINDFGRLAGSYKGRPAIWEKETQVTVIPGLENGSATDVTESGWTIGREIFSNGTARAFVWRPGWSRARFLGPAYPAFLPTPVVSVNNAGLVLGELDHRAVVFAPDGTHELIPVPDTVYPASLRGAEINDAGTVVGHLTVIDTLQAGGVIAGFVWRKGRPVTVIMAPTRHWRVQFYATDVDRYGRVFGNLRVDALNSPMVWKNGVFYGLSVLQHDTRIIDVNDCGVAVGFGMLFAGPPGIQHLWLTPC